MYVSPTAYCPLSVDSGKASCAASQNLISGASPGFAINRTPTKPANLINLALRRESPIKHSLAPEYGLRHTVQVRNWPNIERLRRRTWWSLADWHDLNPNAGFGKSLRKHSARYS